MDGQMQETIIALEARVAALETKARVTKERLEILWAILRPIVFAGAFFLGLAMGGKP